MEGIFKGRWYRSSIQLEGDTIVPIPPLEAYDPFDFYYPATELRQGQKSLYLEFLSVNPKIPESILNFCEKWGVLGSHFYLMKMEQSQWANRLRREHSISPDDPLLLKFDSPRSLGFMSMIAKPDVTKYSPDTLCSPLTMDSFCLSQGVLQNALDPPEELGAVGALNLLNEEIRHSHIRPQITWNIQKEKHELFWPSLTLGGYFYLMAMWDLLGPGKIISCPHCKNYFLAASDRTKFCSSTCYNNSKVQKYQRKKKEEKLAAQKGKKGKATKSTGKNK